jgi:hypothetical protein
VLDLVAEARYEGARFGPMPAVGWEHDFQKVTGVLNLPPGWRLLGATGVDRMDGSWIQRWTLLDFFVVLIITLAVFKLRNWRWGLLALVTMALMFQEPNAPIYVWLHILAVMALLKVLPEGKIRGLVKLWGVAAIVFLLVVSIPFMVQQVRWGLYPQLAHPQSVSFFPGGGAPAPATVQRDAREAVRSAEVDQEVAGSIMRTPSMAKFKSGEAPAIEQFDPQALVQTGPGLPRWRWGVHRFEWNGPVQSDQTMRLWLVPPMVNFMLAILRVLLLGAFILGVVSLKDWWQVIRTRLKPAAQDGRPGVSPAHGHRASPESGRRGGLSPARVAETIGRPPVGKTGLSAGLCRRCAAGVDGPSGQAPNSAGSACGAADGDPASGDVILMDTRGDPARPGTGPGIGA